jgi:hypothetical protein
MAEHCLNMVECALIKQSEVSESKVQTLKDAVEQNQGAHMWLKKAKCAQGISQILPPR